MRTRRFGSGSTSSIQLARAPLRPPLGRQPAASDSFGSRAIRMALQCVLSGLLLALPVAFSESTHAQDATPSVRIESDRATPHATSGEVVRVVGSRINLEITERFSKVLEFPSRIAAVDGHDEDVLTVHPLSPSKIRLQSVS